MILGVMDHIYLIQAYLNENIPLENEITRVIEQLDEGDELIIFSDILGGSVTNQLMITALKPGIHLLSGFNLPLLIEVLMSDENTPAEEVIHEALQNAKDQLVYVNELLTAENNEND